MGQPLSHVGDRRCSSTRQGGATIPKPDLDIRFLGDPAILHRGTPLDGVDSPRLQSLLAYLLLHAGTPQSRSHLAFLFWPDSTETQAMTNLRKQIYHLRHVIPGADRFLHADARTVEWQSDAPYTLDAGEFQAAVARAEEAGAGGQPAAARNALERAIALYQGDYLPGCYEDWALAERDRLQQMLVRALESLAGLLENEREYEAAIAVVQRLLRHDRLHEAGYRQLMRLHALHGDRARALHAYHAGATLLQRELGVEPSAATREVYERLLELDAPSPSPARAGAIGVRLVGREQEWTRLQAAWHTAARGRPHLVLLSGVAGIGKTRLAESMLQWAERQGIPAAAAHCYASLGELAYGPVAAWLRCEALRPVVSRLELLWLGELARLLPELLVERPAIPLPAPLTESWQRQQLFQALAAAFLTPGKLILLLDDMQWSDPETLAWLAYLLHSPTSTQLLVVVTLRREELADGGHGDSFLAELRHAGQVTQVDVGPLSQAETAALADQAAGWSLDPDLAAGLFAETEGNPLFVVEMVRAGLPTGRPGAENGGQGDRRWPLPAAVRDAIVARLRRLSPGARELLAVAATVGRRFDYGVLALASNLDEDSLVRSLDELWQHDIVREQGLEAYDFGHDRVREVVYDELSAARRRLLHRRVAVALERLHASAPGTDPQRSLDQVSGQLAMHFERAGLPEQALPYYERAANQAANIYAHRQAEGYYAQAAALALRLRRGGEQVTRLLAARGQMLEHAGRYEAAIRVYRELETVAGERGDTAMEGAALAQLVKCFIEPNDAHNPDLAVPLIERGLVLVRGTGNHELESQFLWSKMVAGSHYGEAGEAQAAGQASIAIARRHHLPDRLAYVLNDLALNLRLSGRLDEGNAAAAEARGLFQQQNNLPMLADNLNQAAWSAFFQLDVEGALGQVEESIELCHRINNGWNLALARFIRSQIRTAQGAWGAALDDLEASIETGVEAGLVLALTSFPAELGRLLRLAGRVDRALALHQEAHAVSLRRAPFLLRAVEAQLALDAFAAGDAQEGRRWLASLLARPPRGEVGTAWMVLTYPAEAMVAAADHGGAWAPALAAVDQGLAEAERRHLPIYLPRLRLERGRCLQRLGRPAEAEAALRQSLADSQAVAMRPVEWQAHAELAGLHQAGGRHDQATAGRQAAAAIALDIAGSLADPALRRDMLSVPPLLDLLTAT